MANYPLFRVYGYFGGEPSSVASFRLKPTRVLWAWIAVGCGITFAPLLQWGLVQAVMLAFAVWHLLRLHIRRRTLDDQCRKFRGVVGLYQRSPVPARRNELLLWRPVAIATVLAIPPALIPTAVSLWDVRNIEPDGFMRLLVIPANQPFLVLLGMLAVLITALHAMIAWRAWWGRDLAEMSHWYASLPAAVRALVRNAVTDAPRFPSTSWRQFADVSREVHSAGVAAAFISEHDVNAISHRSFTWALWLLAPTFVPLGALIVVPILATVGGLAHLPDKMLFACSIMVWAVWASGWFQFEGNRNFSQADPPPRGGAAITIAQATSRMYVRQRKVWREYFLGQGVVIVRFLAVAVVPAYMTYIGLYDHEAPKAECKTAIDYPSTQKTPDFRRSGK
jgi:hypothetical protein